MKMKSAVRICIVIVILLTGAGMFAYIQGVDPMDYLYRKADPGLVMEIENDLINLSE